MPESNNGGASLVVTTNHGDYYVIPNATLEQFRATPEQQKQIDEAVDTQVSGTFAPLEADEASAESSFASTSETTALAWYQDV